MSDSPTPLEIRTERTRRRLTQRVAGSLIGAALRTFQDWEYGKRKFPNGTLWRLWLREADRQVRLQPKPIQRKRKS